MMKSKKIKLICIVMFLFQGYLFSEIYSRVTGIVRDKDTGTAIKGAVISLVYYFSPNWRFNKGYIIYEVKSDEKGRFVMDKIVNDGKKFFIQCQREEYASLVPEYYMNTAKYEYPKFEKLAGVFSLKIGAANFIDIRLEKGGKLKVNVFIKNTLGITKAKDCTVELLRANTDDDAVPSSWGKELEVRSYGIFNQGTWEPENTMGLEPFENYSVRIKYGIGYLPKTIQNIAIRKNETTTVNYTFDLTDKTGLKGIVTKNGIPFEDAFVHVYKYPENFNEEEVINLPLTSEDGQYAAMLLDPGIYKVYFTYFDENKQHKSKSYKIEIKKDITTILNVDF